MPRRASSLRLRLLAATVVLVALALAAAAAGFEQVARGVVTEAVLDHLSARSREVHEAVHRFQEERALTVRNWAEAEAMQLTLDSGDPKFAEDYLRRLIQEQGGSIAAAALVGPEAALTAGVRAGAAGARRGTALSAQRDRSLRLDIVDAALEGTPLSMELGRLSQVDADGGDEVVVLVAVPVKDFASDVVGAMLAAISTRAMGRLLAEINGNETALVPVVHDASHALVLVPPGVDPSTFDELIRLAGAPGTLERLNSPSGEALLAVRTAPAEEPPGWSSAMVEREAQAYGRLATMRLVLAVLYGVVLVGAALASVWALQAATRPLSEVAVSMSRVASGDLTTRLPEVHSGELGHLVGSFNTMVAEVARSRDELQRTEALRREVQIAHRIQTAILPSSPAVPGYEVAARMKPAEDVGGDLYDVLAFPDTFWVLIGDVSGHGINSGLVMMMAQAAAYAAIADDPHGRPASVITAVNRVIHENVVKRMGRDDYLTLMAVRHLGGGRFLCAGAHQPVFIGRAAGGVEVLEPAGPWMGLTEEVGPGVVEREFQLGPGDLLCLITDGVVEATSAGGELFGEDRLAALLCEPGPRTAAQVLQLIFERAEAFLSTQSDDMTAVILRRTHDDHS
ncbi:MAG: SpoIIE family protein phosphatase [Anaeromyxobacter sp.]|nr:SpoIIE family protein phosphatase [Anaeromyxobacter sp.]MBL0278551.1 SpoIIE family protein phosphatase [Anaeromyxobacter sp.]